MTELTPAGHESHWSVFTSRTKEGTPVVVRSRAHSAALRTFAATNMMARLRCIPSAQGRTDDAGMPLTVGVLDEYDDALLRDLERSRAAVYEVAVVTGGGLRDLFFVAPDREELVAAIEKIRADRPFRLQIAWLDGSNEGLRASLCPPGFKPRAG